MDKKTFLEGLAVGVVTGTVASILLAVKSGKETRQEIHDHLVEIQDKIVDKLASAGDFSQKKYDQVVASVVDEYKGAKKLTAKESKDLQRQLAGGFATIKNTVKLHSAPAKPAAKTPAKPAAKAPAKKAPAKPAAKPAAKVAAKPAAKKAVAKPAAKAPAKAAAKPAAKPAAKKAPAKKAPAKK
jgi:gas vesicle protein